MKNNNPYVFEKNLKKNSVLKSNYSKSNDIGYIKYFPSTFKEWKNNIYSYNNSNIYFIPVFKVIIDKLIKYYFNLFFFGKNYKLSLDNHKFSKGNPGFKQIYISKSELNFNYSKAIVTIYVFNKQKLSLLKKIKSFYFFIKQHFLRNILLLFIFLNKQDTNPLARKIIIKKKTILYKLSLFLERYKLKFYLNQFKFKDSYIYLLANIISKFYKRKVEFNIVNLNSPVYNSDIFTQILGLKLRNRNTNTLKAIKFILNKVFFPKVNRIKEKSNFIKSVNYALLQNKYKNVFLNFLIKNNLDERLKEFYNFYLNNNNSSTSNLYKILFNSIRYKNLGGIKLETKGRLTRRYRADKTQLKIRSKGSLKNIDSSYKKLSSVLKRNTNEYNLDYSLYATKRRVGAFAVKGWISGK